MIDHSYKHPLGGKVRIKADGSVEPAELLTWHSSLYDFSLTMARSDAESVSGPGPADENVATLTRTPAIASQLDALDPESIRRELRKFGAWEAEELADDDANRERLVWIAGCELREEGGE